MKILILFLLAACITSCGHKSPEVINIGERNISSIQDTPCSYDSLKSIISSNENIISVQAFRLDSLQSLADTLKKRVKYKSMCIEAMKYDVAICFTNGKVNAKIDFLRGWIIRDSK